MRKRFKIPLWFLATIVVFIGTALLWLTQTSWLKDRLALYVNGLLIQVSNVQLTAGNLSGNFINGFALDDVVVTGGPSHDTVAVISRITLHYTIRDLLAFRRSVDRVEITDPQIFLPADSLESWWHMLRGDSVGTTARGGGLDLRLRMLVIQNGNVRRRGAPTPLADSIQIQAELDVAGQSLRLRFWPSTARTEILGPLSVSGQFRRDSASWQCDSVSVRTGRSDLFVSGTADSWRLQARPLVLEDIRALIGLEVSGRLNLEGTLAPDWPHQTCAGVVTATGTLEGLLMQDVLVRFKADRQGAAIDSLHGRIADASWNIAGRVNWASHPEQWRVTGQVRSFNLERYASGTIPTDLSGQLDLSGVGTTGRTLRIEGGVDLRSGRVGKYRFDRAAGSIRASADSLNLDDGFALEINGARLEGGGAIGFADSLDLFADVTCGDLRVWDPMIFVDSLAGRAQGYLHLSGPTADPDLTGAITSDSLRMYRLSTRSFETHFQIPRFLSERGGTISGRWGAASTWGVATDSIETWAHLVGKRVVVDKALWYSPYCGVSGGGVIDWSADTIPIQLYPLTVRWENQNYFASDSLTLTLDSAGANLTHLEFEGPMGVARVDGRLDFDTRMDLNIDVDRFRFESLWRRFFPDLDLKGLLEARGRLQGTFADPRFDLAGGISEFTYGDDSYGDLEGALNYADRRLAVDWLRLVNPDFRVEVSGAFPINLVFAPVTQRVLDTTLSGHLEASGTALDRLARWWPQTLESIHGPFTVSADVSGTPLKPRFAGQGSLHSGTIKAVEIVNPLEDAEIDLSLRQDTVLITHASGVVREKGRDGKIQADGRVQVQSYNQFDFDLRLVGRGVPAHFEFQDFAVTSDFDLAVKGASPPTVSGDIRPTRVEDREPFSIETGPTLDDATLWNWDMKIETPGNYWIRNEKMEAELSADLRLSRLRGQVNYIGTAEFIRGQVFLFDKAGRITRGTLTFDDPSKPDPRLDIDVAFRIQQPRVQSTSAGSGGGAPFTDLNLHVGGRASEPSIEAQAPYTEQDVLLLLAANSTLATSDSTLARDPWADRLKFAATGLVFSEVQRMAGRKLGLETLEISSGTSPLDAQVSVGRYFSPHLYLYGSSPIDVGGGQEVGFEYRFTRRVFLEGNRDKDNHYRLNLHFNWDY